MLYYVLYIVYFNIAIVSIYTFTISTNLYIYYSWKYMYKQYRIYLLHFMPLAITPHAYTVHDNMKTIHYEIHSN